MEVFAYWGGFWASFVIVILSVCSGGAIGDLSDEYEPLLKGIAGFLVLSFLFWILNNMIPPAGYENMVLFPTFIGIIFARIVGAEKMVKMSSAIYKENYRCGEIYSEFMD